MKAAGYQGLLDGIRTFDRRLGFKPATHFAKRIRGAMLDALRELDPLKSPVRRRVKASQALAERLGREPTPAEIAEALGVERSVANGIYAHLVARRKPFVDQLVDRREECPSVQIQTAYARSYLLRGLSATERAVISGYYFDGKAMKQIGAELGKSESRISQIVSDVLKRLRRDRNYSTEREAV